MLENLKNLKLVCSLTMSDLLHTTRWMQQLQRDALKIALGIKLFGLWSELAEKFFL